MKAWLKRPHICGGGLKRFSLPLKLAEQFKRPKLSNGGVGKIIRLCGNRYKIYIPR